MHTTTDKPLVSIVIPTYNRWPLVAEAVTSALQQKTRAAYEVVVVDDGSTDGTASLLRERFGDAVSIIVQDNHGRSVARNRGAAVSHCRYVCFLDSDDVLEPWHVEQLFSALVGEPEDATRFFSADVVYWDPVSARTWPLKWPTFAPADIHEAVLVGTVLPLEGLFVPAATFVATGGFDSELDGSEDWLFLVDLVQHAQQKALPRASVRVRVHDDRSMADTDWDLRWRQIATDKVLRKWGRQLTAPQQRLVQAGLERYCAARRYEAGDRTGARAHIRRVLDLVGWRSAARWIGRLWLQTLLPEEMLVPARRVRAALKSQGAG